MKARYRRIQLRDLRDHVVDLDELYRVRPWPKPRRARRLRRQRARRWAAMSPAERALHTTIADGLRDALFAELDAQILYGDGQGGELTGILGAEHHITQTRQPGVVHFEVAYRAPAPTERIAITVVPNITGGHRG